MNILKSSLMAVAALAFAATLASVQPASAQETPPHGPDGMTMDQFVGRQTARLMAADTDGDGRISRAEMAALATMGAGKGGQDPSRRFDAMDTNHDGYLDKDEIRAAFEKRFHRMDLNGDGILTPEERMAGRPQHQPSGLAPAGQPTPSDMPSTAQP